MAQSIAKLGRLGQALVGAKACAAVCLGDYVPDGLSVACVMLGGRYLSGALSDLGVRPLWQASARVVVPLVPGVVRDGGFLSGALGGSSPTPAAAPCPAGAHG